jgi:hypothetical protein
MMIGKWSGNRKFASSTRVAAYSGVAAPRRMSAVESNQVMASHRKARASLWKGSGVLKKTSEDCIAELVRVGSWPEIIADLDSLTETKLEQDSKRLSALRRAPRRLSPFLPPAAPCLRPCTRPTDQRLPQKMECRGAPARQIVVYSISW